MLNRTIFSADNLDVLREMDSGSVDLVYLDPPFNTRKQFTSAREGGAAGFSDRFTEADLHKEWAGVIQNICPKLSELLNFTRSTTGAGAKAGAEAAAGATANAKAGTGSAEYNFCYLSYMSIRLLEMWRVLRDTGSIYLHCDPTMSHYLKLAMDCIFGEANFRNEIIWGYKTGGTPHARPPAVRRSLEAADVQADCRASSPSPRLRAGGQFARKHDTILFYSKSARNTFSHLRQKSYAQTLPEPHTKSAQKLKVERDALAKFRMVRMRDWWVNTGIMPEDDIPALYRNNRERTDYPTQKPLALLERIIRASSNEGDMVLDPFCGSATTCVAAEKLNRQWIGIDLSPQVYDIAKKRLKAECAQSPLNWDSAVKLRTNPRSE